MQRRRSSGLARSGGRYGARAWYGYCALSLPSKQWMWQSTTGSFPAAAARPAAASGTAWSTTRRDGCDMPPLYPSAARLQELGGSSGAAAQTGLLEVLDARDRDDVVALVGVDHEPLLLEVPEG